MTQLLIPVVIDADPGVDDALAILFALASPELEVACITTVFGNADVAATTRHAFAVLDTAGRPDIPVAAGAAAPLAGRRTPKAAASRTPACLPYALRCTFACDLGQSYRDLGHFLKKNGTRKCLISLARAFCDLGHATSPVAYYDYHKHAHQLS